MVQGYLRVSGGLQGIYELLGTDAAQGGRGVTWGCARYSRRELSEQRARRGLWWCGFQVHMLSAQQSGRWAVCMRRSSSGSAMRTP